MPQSLPPITLVMGEGYMISGSSSRTWHEWAWKSASIVGIICVWRGRWLRGQLVWGAKWLRIVLVIILSSGLSPDFPLKQRIWSESRRLVGQFFASQVDDVSALVVSSPAWCLLACFFAPVKDVLFPKATRGILEASSAVTEKVFCFLFQYYSLWIRV